MKIDIKFALLAGAVVGAGIGIAQFLKENKSQAPVSAIPFASFWENQITADVLDGRTLMKQFESFVTEDGTLCAAFFPTGAMLKLFHLADVPPDLDPNSNLMLLAFDAKSNQIKCTKLISFISLSEKVQKLFGTNDYIFIKED